MNVRQHQPRGRYFQDFQLGETLITTGRTITEADIVNFAGLSGDYNQIHTDAQFAAGSFYGRRVAHGLLVLSIASGLSVQTGFMEGTVIAFREVGGWKFSRPVFVGDTVRVRLEITELKPVPRLGGGSVTMKAEVLNQEDQVVQRGHWIMLVQSRS